MYRSDLNSSDKGGAITAAIAIQAALLIAFLNISGKIESGDTQSKFKLVDFDAIPSAPQVFEKPKLANKKSGSARANIKSEATPVVSPKPVIAIPSVAKNATTETPREAVDPTQGASPVRGIGTGAGGVGNGTGTGAGNGSGDGTGAVEPPHLATPVLRGGDFSPDLIDQWPRAATVFLRLKVDARGYVAECMLDRGTNVPEIDAAMCNTAHERLRFRPALSRSGEPVAGWFGYAQPAPR